MTGNIKTGHNKKKLQPVDHTFLFRYLALRPYLSVSLPTLFIPKIPFLINIRMVISGKNPVILGIFQQKKYNRISLVILILFYCLFTPFLFSYILSSAILNNSFKVIFSNSDVCAEPTANVIF